MNAKQAFQIIILSFFGGIFLIPFAPAIATTLGVVLLLSVCGYTLMTQRYAVSICVCVLS